MVFRSPPLSVLYLCARVQKGKYKGKSARMERKVIGWKERTSTVKRENEGNIGQWAAQKPQGGGGGGAEEKSKDEERR